MEKSGGLAVAVGGGAVGFGPTVEPYLALHGGRGRLVGSVGWGEGEAVRTCEALAEGLQEGNADVGAVLSAMTLVRSLFGTWTRAWLCACELGERAALCLGEGESGARVLLLLGHMRFDEEEYGDAWSCYCRCEAGLPDDERVFAVEGKVACAAALGDRAAARAALSSLDPTRAAAGLAAESAEAARGLARGLPVFGSAPVALASSLAALAASSTLVCLLIQVMAWFDAVFLWSLCAFVAWGALMVAGTDRRPVVAGSAMTLSGLVVADGVCAFLVAALAAQVFAGGGPAQAAVTAVPASVAVACAVLGARR